MAERSIFVQLILFYAHRKAQISCFIIAIAQINQVFMTKVLEQFILVIHHISMKS